MHAHSGCELRIYESLTYLNPDGSPIPVEIYSRGRHTEDGLRIIGLVRDVSEREADRKKLEASERQTNLLFENSPISIAIYASDGRLLRVNKAHDELWGICLADLENDFIIFNDAEVLATIGKDKLDSIFKGERVVLEPFLYKGSLFPGHEGNDKTIMPMFFPLKNDKGEVESIVQMHIDFTEQVASEKAISDREAFCRTLINSTNDGFALLEPDETVIDANAEYVRLTGHSDLSEIKGKISRQWVDGDMGLAELKDLLKTGVRFSAYAVIIDMPTVRSYQPKLVQLWWSQAMALR